MVLQGSKGRNTSPKYLYHAAPGETPGSLFYATAFRLHEDDEEKEWTVVGRRYLRRNQEAAPGEILIFTDGACPRNGMFGAAGTCTVVYEPFESTSRIDDTLPAEKHGHAEDTALPEYTRGINEEYCPATINRAKLYATTVALGAQPWAKQSLRTLMIATDLEYVVSGITNWVWRWRLNGWRASKGKPVANRDLWEELIEKVEEVEEAGVSVKFWKIARPASLAQR